MGSKSKEVTMSNAFERIVRRPRLGIFAALVSCFLLGCTGGSGDALSGTYVAKNPDGSMTLEFKAGNKVRLTMLEKGGKPDISDGDYMIDGDQVTVQVPGGIPMVLTRKGGVLEGDVASQILRFSKK